jgi:hypothetical protein
MTIETYRQLCEAARFVSAAAERRPEPNAFLGEWQQWARIFLAGLYYSKTAQRAAQSARIAAESCGADLTRASVAQAAALVADGVVAAAQRDEMAARGRATNARSILQTRSDVGGRQAPSQALAPSRPIAR